ncbi:MAG: hypothetical protein U9R24_00525 [Thermodesulfobacteriota bacterium]|nr:hypothetical protein [Thermodesulfobacteriota bacterium]
MSKTTKLPNVQSSFTEQNGIPTCINLMDLSCDDQSKHIEEMARKATTRAANDALRNGRAITIQQGNNIVKKFPNGKIEVISKLKNVYFTPKKRIYKL